MSLTLMKSFPLDNLLQTLIIFNNYFLLVSGSSRLFPSRSGTTMPNLDPLLPTLSFQPRLIHPGPFHSSTSPLTTHDDNSVRGTTHYIPDNTAHPQFVQSEAMESSTKRKAAPTNGTRDSGQAKRSKVSHFLFGPSGRAFSQYHMQIYVCLYERDASLRFSHLEYNTRPGHELT